MLRYTQTLRSPNFLFIGPDKSGSTWLYKILEQHPQCFVPVIKDIYYFDRNYHRNEFWYLSFFKSATPSQTAIGELSHDYLFSTKAAERICSDFPEMKLITCLRNPVERTFSHYLHWRSRGLTDLSFEEAIDRHSEFIEHSLYFKHLSYYYTLFSKEQIRILFFDDLQSGPRAFAEKVFDFLEVGDAPEIDYAQKIMAASRPRNSLLARYLRSMADLVRNHGHPEVVGYLKYSPLTKIVYKSFSPNEKPTMAQNTRQRLINRFQPDIANLADLLKTDLPTWT